MKITAFIDLFPTFIQAFSLNIIIAVSAMAVGTGAGFYITKCHLSTYRFIQIGAKALILIFRNVPSFVLLFYLVLIIPSQFSLGQQHVQIPAIAKAIFALGAPVTAFACDYFLEIKNKGKPFQLAPWNQYFIVILMASTTASIIGVKEIMATANASIAMSGNNQMVLPIYSLVALWFITCSLFFSWFIKCLEQKFMTSKSKLKVTKKGH